MNRTFWRSLIGTTMLLLSLTQSMSIAAAASASTEDAAPLNAKEMMASMGIELEAKKREVRLEATVCLDHGILEYLVCVANRGNSFEHESIFSTRCTPSVLHLALLAIGIDPCAYESDDGWEKTWERKPASRVKILVEYVHEGKLLQFNVNELLAKRSKDVGDLPDAWIFTGSYFGIRDGKQVYAADAYGGVVGFGLDEASVLQSGKRTGNPYTGEKAGFEINAGKTPPQGTKVTLIFAPVPERAPKSESK